MGVRETSALGTDEEGALQSDLEAASDCCAIDRPDDRLVDHGEEPVQPVAVPLRPLAGPARWRRRWRLPRDLLEVDASTEGGVSPSHDHRVDAKGPRPPRRQRPTARTS